MKKSLFLVPVFALSLGFASCSNEEVVTTNNDTTGNFETNYLSINLVQAPDLNSRDDAAYENGTETENTVTSVRFYFFDNNGKAVSVKKVGEKYQNYFDWTKTDDPNLDTSVGKDNPNVEKKLQAVVVINTEEKDQLPSKVVAILNPGNLSLKTTDLLNLSDLQTAIDFAKLANQDSPVFIMSNSVYDEDNNTIVATDIPTTYYANSIENAKANPVNIYVERTVAKVRISLDSKLTTNGYIALKDQEGKEIKIGDKQVYVKFNAWNLTADTDKGNLFKDITKNSWTNIFSDWNNPTFHRSYWANNASGVSQRWHSYNDIFDTGKPLGTDVLYANENAPSEVYSENYSDGYKAEKFTKVIISGTLYIDNEGSMQEVTLCKYAGLLFNGQDVMLQNIISGLGANTIYKDANNTTPISVADVKLVSALSIDKATKSETTQGRYNVYVQLNQDGDWFDNKGVKLSDPNKYLFETIGKAQVYTNGATYYYFPIQHLGNEKATGQYGVVRNHIYDCQITAITGLGTPVFDPDNDTPEDIYPEKPVEDDTFIAAQINILSWRFVSSAVTLDW